MNIAAPAPGTFDGKVSPLYRPRVLHVITRLTLGGAERVALDLMGGMHGGFDFGVYAVNGMDSGALGQSMKDELEGMSVPLYTGTRVPVKYGGLALAAFYGARAIDRYRPDLIHLHTEIPESSYAVMTAMHPALRHIPVVRTIHNSIYWESWRRLGLWCDRQMRQAHVACVSTAAREAYLRLRAASGAEDSESTAIIYNGVKALPLRRVRKKARSSRVRILYAGRFEHQKGVDLLPAIIRRVSLPDGMCCHLEIFGAGPYEGVLRDLASTPPPGWTIAVTPPVPNITSRFADFDILIMPSRYEGLGLVAIEAILMGLPAIITHAPGLRETMPEDYAFSALPDSVESFADILGKALDDPESLHRAARQARSFARRRFDVARMYAGYEGLYAKALRNSDRIASAPVPARSICSAKK